MVCDVKKVDSNETGLSYAEEECLGELPVSPVWYGLEPNSYDDLGSELTLAVRKPINRSRQRRKGTVADLEASGGFNQDITQNNLKRLLQGFMFANAREKVSNHPLNGTQIPLTAVDSGTKQYRAASGLGVFVVGTLIFATGFATNTNNGLKSVTTVGATAVTVSETLVSEASPTSAATIQTVGFQFPASDLALTVAGDIMTLTSTAGGIDDLLLNVGEWIFIGGDATATQFVGNTPGYARISTLSDTVITFDKTTWTPAANNGSTKTIRIFFGSFLRNESEPADIIRRSYQIERTLGEDVDGTQSEYLIGAVANELTINIPTPGEDGLINVDMSFVATDSEDRTGLEAIKAGTRVDPLVEDAFNTASDVFRMSLTLVENATLNPAKFFAYLSELTITINNNATGLKAIGNLGSFDINIGTFEVGGSITAYFAGVAAKKAIRANADVTLDVITTKDNSAIIYDVPLIALGGGRANVEADSPITIPVESSAAEGPNGYTLSLSFMPYVPNIGIAG